MGVGVEQDGNKELQRGGGWDRTQGRGEDTVSKLGKDDVRLH